MKYKRIVHSVSMKIKIEFYKSVKPHNKKKKHKIKYTHIYANI